MTNLTILSKPIRLQDGRYLLNDLHKAAGNQSKHRPSYFLAGQQIQELIAELEKDGIPAIYKKQRIGTYACKELVYAYAMWISPKFHLHVIRAFDAMVSAIPQPVKQLPAVSNDEDQKHFRSMCHYVELLKEKEDLAEQRLSELEQLLFNLQHEQRVRRDVIQHFDLHKGFLSHLPGESGSDQLMEKWWECEQWRNVDRDQYLLLRLQWRDAARGYCHKRFN